MFNILSLLSWRVWLIITLVIIFIFWIIWGGKHEYEFVGVQPLTTPKIIQSELYNSNEDYSSPNILTLSGLISNPDIKCQNIGDGVSKYQNIGDSVSKSSKGEDLVAEALQNILQSPIKRNIRPNFLRNPETGKNMEIDCFNEDYAVAVEYNGIQHYKFPSVFYKNKEDFYAQVYRDRLKRKLCDENNIYLISIPYWVDMFGTEDNHFHDDKEGITNNKIAFVSREVRYQRIYDYLYKKLSEYFEIIFPQEKNEDEDQSSINRWDIYNPY